MTEISKKIVCSGQTLTATYADLLTGGDLTDGIFEINKISQITIYREYTPGATETNNTMELQLLVSNDKVVWHVDGEIDATSVPTAATDNPFGYQSALTSAPDTAYGVPIRRQIDAQFFKLQAKETGKATNFGTVKVTVNIRYV